MCDHVRFDVLIHEDGVKLVFELVGGMKATARLTGTKTAPKAIITRAMYPMHVLRSAL